MLDERREPGWRTSSPLPLVSRLHQGFCCACVHATRSEEGVTTSAFGISRGVLSPASIGRHGPSFFFGVEKWKEMNDYSSRRCGCFSSSPGESS